MFDWSKLTAPTVPAPESQPNGQQVEQPAEPPKPAEVVVVGLPATALKGDPVWVLSRQTTNVLSDTAVYCGEHNAVHVEVFVNGTSPSATISVEGCAEQGGTYLALPAYSAKQSAVIADTAFDVPVGSAWVKVRVADISGTFGSGQGYSIRVTPYTASGLSQDPPALLTLAASAARTADGTGTAVTGLGWRKRYVVLLDITASATDAADTLDVYVDVSLDGSTWLNAIHFTQQAGDGAAAKEYAVLDPSSPGTATIAVTSDAASGAVRPSLFGPQMRARWVIADAGTPGDQSHTFSVVAYAQ